MAEVRPIDANALMELARNHVGRTVDCNDIARFPILDYAPVRHGEWTTIDSSYWRWKPDGPHHVMRLKYEHTECGKIVAKKEPYCPRCGAKMDGGKEQ